MTHYNIEYDLDDLETSKVKALGDIKEFVGVKRYDHLVDLFRQYDRPPFEEFQMMASLAGIQGFPVRAWYSHCYEVPIEDVK